MDQAGARTQLWTNRSLLVLFLVCLGFGVALARPFISPLVLASFLVAVCYGPYQRFEARLGRRRHTAAALATMGVGVVMVLPAAIFLTLLFAQLSGWTAQLQDWLGPDGFSRVVSGHLPPRVHGLASRYLPVGQQELEGYLARISAYVSESAPGVITFSVELLIQAFVLVLAIYYLFLDGRRLVRWVTAISPMKPSYTRELLHEFYRVAYAMLVGTASVAALQGVAAAALFWGLGIPNPLVWAMALAFASFVPAVGVGLVYVPMTAYLLIDGHPNKAMFCLAYSVLLIVIVIDHLVRPMLVRGKLTMHPLVVFVAIFGGVYLFGLVGLLLGPLVAAILVTVLRIYARDFTGHLEREAPAPAPTHVRAPPLHASAGSEAPAHDA